MEFVQRKRHNSKTCSSLLSLIKKMFQMLFVFCDTRDWSAEQGLVCRGPGRARLIAKCIGPLHVHPLS